MKAIRFQRLLTACSVMLFLLAAACTKEPSTSPAKTKTEEAQPSPSAGSPSPGDVDTSTDLEDAARALVAAKWTGDLDGMIKRRLIRVLTVYSKTGYFVDRGTQRGLTYESFQLFEEDLNKKLKNKHVRVIVAMVPVAHDDLIPALVEGSGRRSRCREAGHGMATRAGGFYESNQKSCLVHRCNRPWFAPDNDGARPGRERSLSPPGRCLQARRRGV